MYRYKLKLTEMVHCEGNKQIQQGQEELQAVADANDEDVDRHITNMKNTTYRNLMFLIKDCGNIITNQEEENDTWISREITDGKRKKMIEDTPNANSEGPNAGPPRQSIGNLGESTGDTCDIDHHTQNIQMEVNCGIAAPNTLNNEENSEQLLNIPRQQQNHCNKKAFIGRENLETFDESTVDIQDVGSMNNICAACGALMFKDETHCGKLTENSPTATFSSCCANGNIVLPPIKDSPELLKKANNIRAYNSSLAFTSLGLTGKEFKFRNPGPYCYRINGQLYHSISHLQPEQGKPPRFSQIYIYDQQHELDNHMRPFPTMDHELLLELQQMIKSVNPYAHKYLQVTDLMEEHPIGNIKMVLR